MEQYKVTNNGPYEFTLGFGSHTQAPTPNRIVYVPTGSIVEYVSTAPNGNVWFYYNGERGKIESGSLQNLIDKNVITKTGPVRGR